MRKTRTTAVSIATILLALAALIVYALGGRSRPAPPPTTPKPLTPAPAPAPTPESKAPVEAARQPSRPLLKFKTPAPSIIPAGARPARVQRVTDGDTIVLEDGRRVRYIGIDSPERNDPLYEQGKRFNESLVLNRPVYLELDVQQTDPYDRLLAYVYVRLEDGPELCVNAEILRQGWARLYTFPPNVKHVETFGLCQKEAIDERRGMWKNYVFDSETYFVGTRNGRAYHRPDCRMIAGVRPETLIKYADARQALEAHKSPCRACKP
ncbi:MAG: thermonuclease family protein [Planctomycetes bacterium]|nr:thermonuclease family protein [Planctomycetota bacterium]